MFEDSLLPYKAVLRCVRFKLCAIDVEDIGLNRFLLNQMFSDVYEEVFDATLQAFIDQSLESHV